ncbi:hypothetical protein [Pedobacter antarcticus]|uniref:hypothetical protein n=1 Tax=Pedobacter antarcticus TaxID=34086 RepID=UPI00292F7220|nr:hypothetical protein [Pedobacter antarcticus]
MRKVNVYLNKPQKRAHLVRAKEEYGVWGRATGKTQGPIAERSILAANAMPRGATGIVGTTYMQLLDRTLPPLLKAWERFGYYEGVHYWFRRFPGKFQNVPTAIYPALQPEHCITWWNGHVFHFISQDRPGLANGKNLDAIIADEVRFMNHKRYMDDIAPTNRGNREYFGHLAEHHMITMYTDMPTTTEGKWIFEKEQQMDQGRVQQVVNIQVAYNVLKVEHRLSSTTKARKVWLERKMANYEFVLNELRKGLVYYSEASSLDNIQVLGEEQIKQWRREMLWPVFQASILNQRLIHLENGFYPLFDSDHHTYNDVNYNYIDSLGLYLPRGTVEDCRKDNDVIRGKALDIAMDHNASINSLVIGQDGKDPKPGGFGEVLRILKSMYVKAPFRVQDLMQAFHEYYKAHNCRDINYYYDHTSLHTDSTRTESIADIVTGCLDKNGWKVNRLYIGQQPMHETRFRMWGVVFTEKDPRFKPVRFNQDNAQSVIVSIQRTAVITGKNGFEKDKRPEKNSNFPQEEAPHQGDALDTLYIGKNKNDYGLVNINTDLIFS